MTIRPVELEKAYRLLNHGPTTMISAKYENIENVMSASWVSGLDISPAKITAVIGKQSFTRQLLEKSRWFAVQIPIAKQTDLVIAVGTQSRNENPKKMDENHVKFFYQDGFDVPLIDGCAAWLICRLINEEQNQQHYDLFIAEVVAAWADDRIFSQGHWHFDNADDSLRTLHYVAGGQFYLTGKGIKIDGGP